MLESEKIFPKEYRIKETYQDSENLECLDDWEDEYGDFEDAVIMIDGYHLALTTAENQIVDLQNKNKELLKKCKELIFQDQPLKLDLLERNELNNIILYSEEDYLSIKNDKDKEIKDKENQIKNLKNEIDDLNTQLNQAKELIDAILEDKTI